MREAIMAAVKGGDSTEEEGEEEGGEEGDASEEGARNWVEVEGGAHKRQRRQQGQQQVPEEPLKLPNPFGAAGAQSRPLASHTASAMGKLEAAGADWGLPSGAVSPALQGPGRRQAATAGAAGPAAASLAAAAPAPASPGLGPGAPPPPPPPPLAASISLRSLRSLRSLPSLTPDQLFALFPEGLAAAGLLGRCLPGRGDAAGGAKGPLLEAASLQEALSLGPRAVQLLEALPSLPASLPSQLLEAQLSQHLPWQQQQQQQPQPEGHEQLLPQLGHHQGQPLLPGASRRLYPISAAEESKRNDKIVAALRKALKRKKVALPAPHQSQPAAFGPGQLPAAGLPAGWGG
jgi:hypothetical protein